MNDNRIQHLNMVLRIAEEKATNSDNLKRWCVSLASAFLALSTQHNGVKVAYIALFPIFFLWLLDSYEQLMLSLTFKLYDRVRLLPEEMIDYNLSLEQVQGQRDAVMTHFFKPKMFAFYGSMSAGIFIVDWLIN